MYQVSFTAAELAAKVGGELVGESGRVITGVCSLEEPHPDRVAFTREKRSEPLSKILTANAPGALFCQVPVEPTDLTSVIVVRNPQKALIDTIYLFQPPPRSNSTISPRAEISPSAIVSSGVEIGAFAVIGDECVIEEGAILHPHVVLYPGVKVGKRAIIHSGAVIREGCEIGADCVVQNGAIIGADGFGYIPGPEGLIAVPQIGNVVLSAKVEVGANSCVDRGAIGSTRIGLGTKIDNHVQIGHNVQIGAHSIICGQVGIAGSAKLGNQVVLGGGSGVKDHAVIADGVRLAARAGAIGDIREKGDYGGYPAVKLSLWRKQMALLNRLPEIWRESKGEKETD